MLFWKLGLGAWSMVGGFYHDRFAGHVRLTPDRRCRVDALLVGFRLGI